GRRGAPDLTWLWSRGRFSARAERTVAVRADQPVAVTCGGITVPRGRVGVDHVLVATDHAQQLAKHHSYRVLVAGQRDGFDRASWCSPRGAGCRRGGLIVDADR